MNKFWSWILAAIMAPILMAIVVGVLYGMIWLTINLGNPNNGHLPDIVGALL